MTQPLAAMVAAKVARHGLRESARRSGINANALHRVARGETPRLRTFAALCRWLGLGAQAVNALLGFPPR